MEKGTIRKISLVFIIILILGTGGFFLWKESQKTFLEKFREADYSGSKDYILKETSEGRMVEIKKGEINFKIPADWTIKEEDPSSFYSPDIKLNERRSDIVEAGCEIFIGATYIKTDLETLEKFVNENFSLWSSVMERDQFEKTEVGGQPALKNKYHLDGLKMSYISIDFLFKDNVYKIFVAGPIQESERCEGELDKFLESVSIGKK